MRTDESIIALRLAVARGIAEPPPAAASETGFRNLLTVTGRVWRATAIASLLKTLAASRTTRTRNNVPASAGLARRTTVLQLDTSHHFNLAVAQLQWSAADEGRATLS